MKLFEFVNLWSLKCSSNFQLFLNAKNTHVWQNSTQNNKGKNLAILYFYHWLYIANVTYNIILFACYDIKFTNTSSYCFSTIQDIALLQYLIIYLNVCKMYLWLDCHVIFFQIVSAKVYMNCLTLKQDKQNYFSN